MTGRLYDASSGGNQVSSAITPTLPVSNSLFTVRLWREAGAGVAEPVAGGTQSRTSR
jgi:hypothetical protein